MVSFDTFTRTGSAPIYTQIVLFIQRGIAAGTICSGDELPSRRVLSALLGVNPNTIQKAYQELERRKIIYSVAGKGSFISPGECAGEMIRSRSCQALREAMEDGKRAGLVRADVDRLAGEIYGEE